MKIISKDRSEDHAVQAAKAVAESLGVKVNIIEAESSPPAFEEWVTIREVAKRIKLSSDTVRRLIHRGEIQSKKLNRTKNGAVRIYWPSVVEWLNGCDSGKGRE